MSEMGTAAAKTWAGWPGWPDGFEAYSEIGISSVPCGTEVDEGFPPEDAGPLPPVDAAIEPAWDFAGGRFADAGTQLALRQLCAADGLDVAALSAPDSAAGDRRLPWQPGVPVWALAWRELVSRSRSWGSGESARSRLAGGFYRAFLRAWYAEPELDWPESNDVWLENLYKSCATHGNGRSIDLGDRPDRLDLPANWCGAAASAVLVEALRRGGWRLKLGDDWSQLVHRKDWDLGLTEYSWGGTPKEKFAHDSSADPKPRAGDILTLAVHNRNSPYTGHYAMVLAAKMTVADDGYVYVASGSTGPMRTVAVDLFRIAPRPAAYRYPFAEGTPRPPAGTAWILELNRTSLVLPTKRLEKYSKAGIAQLKVARIPR